MPRFIYYQDASTGNVASVEVARIPYEGTPSECVQPFQQTVLNNYARIEAQQKWPPGASKSLIKRVHETALARDTYNKA